MSDPITRLNAALEGRYRIERELGEGGMATVYLARDEKHNRNVALKVLKPELAAVVGAERFLAEIETTANLQHPHILPLFDSGEADSFLFYVMPHVEGESLRERLAREHQLPVDEAISIATKVARALQEAHERGVVHRDIKPANILLSKGEPLVSDFGIALALGVAGGGRMTETGLSLGTPHYMSPEQATGDLSVGAASDTYALGCVLYEMLVGEPPYTGSTPQAVLGKIVTGDAPSARVERKSVPPHVDGAIRKALEKVPADRFGTTGGLAGALADPSFRHGDSSTVGPAAAAAGSRSPAAMAGWAVALVTVAVSAWALSRPASPGPVARFEITLPQELTRGLGLDIDPAGRRIVFPATDAVTGEAQLYLRAVADLDPTPIPGTAGATRPSFAPDGESVAFVVGESLRTVSFAGTPPQTLVADSVFSVPGISWGADGMIYFGKLDGSLWRVGGGGEDPSMIAPAGAGSGGLGSIDPLPNGGGVLVTNYSAEILVLSPSTGAPTLLFAGLAPRYLKSGHILYTSADGAGTLLVRPFDQDRLEVTGPQRTITEGLFVGVSRQSDFAISDNGSLVYRLGRSGPGEGQVVWVDRDGASEAVDAELAGVIESVAISPDGRKIAFDRTDGGRQDVHVYSLDDGTATRLTFEGVVNHRPAWKPDGSEIGFVSQRDGDQAFFARPWDASAPTRLLRSPVPGSVIWEGHWSPDAQWLLYRQLPRAGVAHLLYAAPDPATTPLSILETEFFNASMSLSPDGRWVAYQSDESGRVEVYVRPFPGPGGQRIVSDGGGRGPIWRQNSIFYLSEGAWIQATVRTEPDFAVESRTAFASTEGYLWANTIQRYDVSPDGERILAIRDLEGAPTQHIFVQNFFEELERLGAGN